LKLTTREVYGAVVVNVEGKLVGGPNNADRFHGFFRTLLEQRKSRIVVNLHKTQWANSQGVGLLLGAYKHAVAEGGDLVLSHVEDRIYDVLSTTRLLMIFRSFDNDDEAIRYLTRPTEEGPRAKNGKIGPGSAWPVVN